MSNNYNDPYWIKLALAKEKKHGLPDYYLAGLLLAGERSNADAVSPKGAKTPFQIIPETRYAALKKYGIDAYLSDENAAEVAALLSKESGERNGFDPAKMDAEYHGGTNFKNHGPITQDYVKRTTGFRKLLGDLFSPSEAGAAEMPTKNEPNPGALKAYRAGKMTSDEAAEFEADFPQVKTSEKSAASTVAEPNKGALKAYLAGKMEPDEAAEFETDFPQVKEMKPVAPVAPEVSQRDKLWADAKELSGFNNMIQTYESVEGGEALTGDKRQTAETQSLPSVYDMPEMNPAFNTPETEALGGIGTENPSVAQMNTRLATGLGSGGKTIANILTSQFPGQITARQDEKGNYILKSEITGKEYAVQPGMEGRDLLNGGMLGALFGPANKVVGPVKNTLANILTQGGVELVKEVAGAKQSPGEIGLNVGMAGAGSFITPGPKPIDKNLINTTREYTEKQMGTIMRLARKGDPDAIKELARLSADNPELLKLADQYQIELPLGAATKDDYITRGVGTVNKDVVEYGENVKSPVKDDVATQVNEVKSNVDRALEKAGASRNLSELNDNIKTGLQQEIEKIKPAESFRNRVLGNLVPKNTAVELSNTEATLNQILSEVGEGFVTKEERDLLKAVARNKKSPSIVNEQGLLEKVPEVTYGSLQRAKSDIGDALSGGQNMFSNVNRGALKRLYGALKEDQKAILKSIGGDDAIKILTDADELTQARIGIQDNVINLYGKEGEKSISSLLQSAITKSSKGDSTSLRKIIDNIPDPEIRKQALASSFMSILKEESTDSFSYFKKFGETYRGLRNNPGLYNEFINGAGKEFGEMLNGLYQLSESMVKMGKNMDTPLPKDSVLAREMMRDNRVLDAVATSVGRLVTFGVYKGTGALVGSQGIANAIKSLGTATPEIQRQFATLFKSSEFKGLVRDFALKGEVSNGVIKQFAGSKGFKEFAKSQGIEPTMSAKEQAVRSLVQAMKEPATDTMQGEENE